MPEPVAPWPKMIITTNEYRNVCIVVAQSQYFPLNNSQSEDCLYLNVYTPGNTFWHSLWINSKNNESNTIFCYSVLQEKKEDVKLTVIFWIHGGGFTEGDSTNGFYGPDFMMENNVVFVTHDYRVGPFGFSNFDEPGYTGNMGLKDQQIALEWVRKNIKHFGGDPDAITVAGESCGKFIC